MQSEQIGRNVDFHLQRATIYRSAKLHQAKSEICYIEIIHKAFDLLMMWKNVSYGYWCQCMYIVSNTITFTVLQINCQTKMKHRKKCYKSFQVMMNSKLCSNFYYYFSVRHSRQNDLCIKKKSEVVKHLEWIALFGVFFTPLHAI